MLEALRRRPQTAAALTALRGRQLNFDPRRRDQRTPERGWHVDHADHALPAEAPGPPAPGGSFEVARRLMRDYAFVDGTKVVALFDRDAPVGARDICLELRFWGLRFHVGVRSADAWDGEREIDGRVATVSGWSYDTLEGHLEMGHLEYELLKWHDTGQVEFRIRAHSRRAPIPNPVVRLGFMLFGRREQLRFYRQVGARLAELTRAELEPSAPEPPREGG